MRAENLRIWDCPSQSDRNSWSFEGMLAVVSKESIVILIPMFDHTRFFRSHGVKIIKSDINRDSNANNVRDTTSNRNDFRLWVTENEIDIETTVKVVFERAEWSPPGFSPGCSSLLASLLSNGMLLLFEVCGCTQEDRTVTADVKLQMFSTSLALDISTSFSGWHVKQKTNNQGVNNLLNDTFSHVITTMAWYPSVIRTVKFSPGGGSCRLNVLLLVTGSSHGALNVWSLTRGSTTTSIRGWTARCAGYVFLSTHGVGGSNGSATESTVPGSGRGSQSITALAFLPRAHGDRSVGTGQINVSNIHSGSSGRSSSSSGRSSSSSSRESTAKISPCRDSLAYLLLCGTRLGHLHLCRFASGGDHDEALLSFSVQPLQSVTLDLGPVDSITVHPDQNDDRSRGATLSYLLYVRCGLNIAIIELCNECFTRQFTLPSAHTNLVTSIAALASFDAMVGTEIRQYAYQGASVLTSSMDGQVILWSWGNDDDPSGNRQRHSSSGYVAPIDQQSIPLPPPPNPVPAMRLTPKKYLTFASDSEGSSRSISSSSKGLACAGRPLPLIDLTVDSSQCIMAVTQIMPRVVSRDRETQMNPKRLRTNTEVTFDLLPSLDALWAFDADLIVSVMRRAVLAHVQAARDPAMNIAIVGVDCDAILNSNCRGGCTWLGGLTLAWIQSVEKYVEKYADDEELVLARQPGVLASQGAVDPGVTCSPTDTRESIHADSTRGISTLTNMQDAAEPEDDMAKVGTGIMGVALRCKALLYPPSMGAVVLLSVEKLLVAATAVARELEVESRGPCTVTLDTTLFDFPSNDVCLQSKMRLWQLLHNLLVASSSSKAAVFTSFDRPLHITECIRTLRSRLRIGHSSLAVKRAIEQYQGQVAAASVSRREIQSLHLLRNFLSSVFVRNAPQVDLSVLSGLIAQFSRTIDVGESGVSVCIACQKQMSPMISSDGDAEDRLLAVTCGGCSAIHDRCCITMQLITLDDVIDGVVMKCPLCRSLAVSRFARTNICAAVSQSPHAAMGSERPKLSHDTPTIYDTERAVDDNGTEEFAWTWWSGRGPYCPFCVVPMVIIT